MRIWILCLGGMLGIAPLGCGPDVHGSGPDVIDEPDSGQCVPGEEICDGLDNDCDGETDEDMGQMACGMGACGTTVPACVDGIIQTCPSIPQGLEEVCHDLQDNNCDGVVDEGCSCVMGARRECGENRGACEAGVQDCTEEGWGTCLGAISPAHEICDGVDNDCDGAVDEGCPCLDWEEGSSRPAGPDLGICEAARQYCWDGYWSDPVGGVPPESIDPCNGLDDNCNGTVDEFCSCIDGEARPCKEGLCYGSQTCLDGLWGECLMEAPLQEEVCDGVDNDCDDEIDEDGVCDRDAGADMAMVDGGDDGGEDPHDVLDGGIWDIDGGDASIEPLVEVCDDGLDNNMDGLVDCHDPGCAGEACGLWGLLCQGEECLCPGGKAEALCEEGNDNDCDGLIDCADPDCEGLTCGNFLTCRSGLCAPAPGTLDWAKGVGGGNSDLGSGIALVPDGSAVITGHFGRTVIFGRGEPGYTALTAVGEEESSCDIFLARYNPDGTLAWAKRAGGAGRDEGLSVAALDEGTSFVAGTFQETALFGEGEDKETSLLAQGTSDIFLARYNPDGTLAWASRAGGPEVDNAWGLSALPDGSSLVTGSFTGEAIFGEGESGQTSLTADGAMDFFLARYNPDGTLAWARAAGGTGTTEGIALDQLSDGSALVTGLFNETATFGRGEPTQAELTSVGNTDIFLARYDPEGALSWAKGIGGPDYEQSLSLELDPHLSGLILTGYFSDRVTFGEGEAPLESKGGKDIFVARFGLEGALEWVRQAGGVRGDIGWDMAIHPDGTFVVTGSFQGEATFGEGEPGQVALLSEEGGDDIFIAQYSPEGSLLWASRAGGSAGDMGQGIVVSPEGSALVTGFFSSTAIFGEGEPGQTSLPISALSDIFLARYW